MPTRKATYPPGINLWCTDTSRFLKGVCVWGSLLVSPNFHRQVPSLRDFGNLNKARAIPCLKVQSCSLFSLWTNYLANLWRIIFLDATGESGIQKLLEGRDNVLFIFFVPGADTETVMELALNSHLLHEWKNIASVRTKACLSLPVLTFHIRWWTQSWFGSTWIPPWKSQFFWHEYSICHYIIRRGGILLPLLGPMQILSSLRLSSCETSAWSSETESPGGLGSEMGSTQQELSDQSRGEKEVRWEIKVQELGRYSEFQGWWPVAAAPSENVPWAGLLSWPSAHDSPEGSLWLIGVGVPPSQKYTISQHYSAGLVFTWSDKLENPGNGLICSSHVAPGVLLRFRSTVLGLTLSVHQNHMFETRSNADSRVPPSGDLRL